MEPIDRPNRTMEAHVFQAMDIANQQTRSAAAEYLFFKRCPLDVIARVLAKQPQPCRRQPPTVPAGRDPTRPIEDPAETS